MNATGNTPVFSISVPIGAYHPLLPECLRSLAAQNPMPQIAVLNASGDDRVAEILDQFRDVIAYRRDGPDKGQSDAILEGWRHVPGDVLGWLNADDALYPDALAIAAAHFKENPDTDIFYGQSVIIDNDFQICGYHWAVAPPSDAILYGDPISQPSCFFRRSKYDAIGGLDIDLHYTMDWDLWVRFWRADAAFGYTDKIMSRVLWCEDAKTGGFGAGRRRELRRIISQNPDLIRRVKSQIGFSLHHFLEYVAPSPVAALLRRARHMDGRGINGITRTGSIVGVGTVPIANWGDEPISKLALSLQGGPSRLGVSAAGVNETVHSPGDTTIVLSRPLPPGAELTIEIDCRESEETVYLKSIAMRN